MTKIKRPGTTSLLGVTFQTHSSDPLRISPRRKRPSFPSFRHRRVVWISLLGGGIVVVLGCLLLWVCQVSLFSRPHDRSNPEIKRLQNIFPIHTSSEEWEEIDHPGFQMADPKRLSAILGNLELPKTKIKVPKFWNPSSAYGGNVRKFLGESGQYLIHKDEADAIGSKHGGHETIFLSLASYRDPECRPTVESIFERAKYPHRIRVAIIDQRDDGEGDPSCNVPAVPCDQDPDQVLCRFSHLIDYQEYEAHLMVGPTFARHIGHRMYRGEYFSMQIDSHVRMVEHWDEDIIDQWRSTGNEMAVLTTYMSDVINSIDPVTHKSLRENRAIMCHAVFDGIGGMTEHVRFGIQPNGKPRIQVSPMLEPFWAAGLSFGRGHFVIQVPYDAYLPFVFQGEEISMTVRAFTYGYDFYAPLRNVAFHVYATRGNKDERLQVKKFVENETLFPGAKEAAYRRLNGIIRLNRRGLDDLPFHPVDQVTYGLGSVRRPETFYRTFGIYPEKSKMEPKLCDFVRGIGPHKSMHTQFAPYLRWDGMGINYDKITYLYRERPMTDTLANPKEIVHLRENIRKKQIQQV